MKKVLLIFSICLISLMGMGQNVLIDDNTKVLIHKPYEAILHDGNTAAWYDATDLTTITKDGGNLVADWRDKLGSGRDLVQATPGNKPTWSATGITFDGGNDYMKAATFGGGVLVQPTTVYCVIKQLSWTINDRIWDGDASNNMLMQKSNTPELRAIAGVESADNGNLAVGVFGIVRVVFNGVSSTLQINETTVTSGNFGANDMNGLTLGVRNSTASSFGHFQVTEIILRNVADDSDTQDIVVNYLADKYSIAGITTTPVSKVLIINNMWLIILLLPNIRRRLRIAA